MHRSILWGVALGAALIVPVSAANFNRYFTSSQGPKIVTGEIRADGNVLRGQGFASRRLGKGQYEIEVYPGFGCSVILVTLISEGFSNLTESAGQKDCGEDFYVTIRDPGTTTRWDHSFQFAIIQEVK